MIFTNFRILSISADIDHLLFDKFKRNFEILELIRFSLDVKRKTMSHLVTPKISLHSSADETQKYDITKIKQKIK